MAGDPPETSGALSLPVGPRDHVRGGGDAPLTLLEYGDFECPQCRSAFPIVRELEQRFGDRLRFVFRHFPLTNVHPHAQAAAEAAEWAAQQGAFWPMHDAIYQTEPLSEDRLLELAAARPPARVPLQAAWAAHTFFPRVKEDFLSGVASGVAGTPAFFVNGLRHEGLWDLETLTRALEAAAPR
jgi:protein-disulfide isomerase